MTVTTPQAVRPPPEVAKWQARLAAQQIGFRAPPPLPTTCCGKGCAGCVWQSYDEAMVYWLEDVEACCEQ